MFDAAPVRGRFTAAGRSRRRARRSWTPEPTASSRWCATPAPRSSRRSTTSSPAIVCTSGTPRSHIGIVSREFQVPCVMGCAFERRRARGRHRGRARLLGRRGGASVADARRRRSSTRQPAHRLPRARSRRALTAGAHLARERAHPGHRLHRRGVRRVLPALPGHDADDRRGACRPRRSAAGPAGPGCQVDPCYLWSIANFFLLGRKIIAMLDPPLDDPARTAYRPRLLGARRARVPRRRHPPGVGHRHRRALRRRHRRRAARRRRADRRRRAPGRGQALQRHARQPPVPAVLRHARRLRRHRPVRGARPARPHAARARLLPAGPERLLVVATSPRTCRTTTSPPRSCSTTCESTFTDFGTSNHTPEDYLDRLVGFGLYTTDGLPPGELRAGARRRARRHRRRRAHGAGAALPQHRGHGPRREDPRRRLRVLHASCDPFAEVAGVADELDWTVPRDLPEPLYQLLSAIEGDNAGVPDDEALLRALPEESP